jgi:hypothetical protein
MFQNTYLIIRHSCYLFTDMYESQGNSVSIATGYGLDDWGLIPGRAYEFFSSQSCPDQLWVPPNLLSNGHQGLFPQE